jgi:glycosyltransferase involved in cell wall biosynthesis
MRIVIDARMLYWTGVGRYTQALLQNLEELDHDNDYLVLVRKADFSRWEPKSPNFKRIRADINPYSFSEQLRLPRLIRSLHPDLVHFTAPNTPLLYYGRTITTIHDLTLIDFDTSRGRGLVRWLRQQKRGPFRLVLWNSAHRATRIITSARFVCDQLVSRYHIPKERISVVPLGVDIKMAQPEPVRDLGVRGDYLLYVGNFYPYKNVISIIEAMGLLKEKYPDLRLVLTGQADYYRAELEREAKRLGVHDRVLFTGFVTDGQLITLYRHAKLYVYPSLSEGFGLQVLEAMALGLPVVAAQASTLPEVCGDAAELFDPTDYREQAHAIDAVLSDDDKRAEMKRRGLERVKDFSWKRTAQQTLLAYHRALGLVSPDDETEEAEAA